MAINPAGFVGDIPTFYDTGLGPNIFVDYADRLATLCAGLNPGSVLELAAGTGIVSRRLRDVLAPDTRLISTDLNPPMLEIARAKFAAGENIELRPADALALPFDDDAFDMIVCQFGVMFFPDKIASFREAARVLKPGGHYVFNVWSDMSENPFSQAAMEVAMPLFPDNPPEFYKVPFHYGNPDGVLADLAQAGWQNVRHETIRLNKTIADPDGFGRGLVYGNPLIDEIRERGGVDPEEVAQLMVDRLHRDFGPEPLVMPLSSTTFTCTAP